MDAMTLVKIQTILTVIIVSLMSFGLATLTYFLDFCFKRTNVFDFWLPWLAKKLTKYRYPLKYEYIMKGKKEEQDKLFIETVEDYGYFKMLGGCATCFNVWLGFMTLFFIISYVNYDVNLDLAWGWLLSIKSFLVLFYLLLSNFFLRKMMQNE